MALSSALELSMAVKALAVKAKVTARTGIKNLDFKNFMITNF